MESVLSSTEKQSLVSSFMEVAAGQSAETAAQFLQATSWRLDEAIQLFYVGNEASGATSPYFPPPVNIAPTGWDIDVAQGSFSTYQYAGDEEVHAPLPVRRETLYGELQPLNFDDSKHDVWESDQSVESTSNGSRDNLSSLYRRPFSLMYHGPFEKAKIEASLQNKWLIVNLQSTEEFNSHMLNRDTWSHEVVEHTIRSNFIFWQVYHDTDECKKVFTYYNLVSLPAILIIDPITGRKMRAWNGMIQPDHLLEALLPYMDRGPKEYLVAHSHKHSGEDAETSNLFIPDKMAEDVDGASVAASTEDLKDRIMSISTVAETKQPVYLPLPEEPKGNRELLCRIGIRLPTGRRLQRNFLRTDLVKLLWPFCCSQLEEWETTRPFRFTQSIPGTASKSLSYESNLTFEESGLSNSLISLIWE